MNTERVFQALYQQNPVPTKGGLVFKDVVLVDAMPNDLDKLALGCDFGYSNDPTAIILCGVDKRKKVVYCDQIVYMAGLDTPAIAAHLKGFERLEMFCDHDNRIIDTLKLRHGFIHAKQTQKGKGSIQLGIHLLSEYTIAITKRSYGLIEESEKYTYKTDGYGNPTDTPIDEYNHGWDAVRYYALSKLTKPERGVLASF